MLAARANQENAIYEQQQAAAAKPLNQGVKGLAPKTPANKPPKTPFGKRNDENANLTFGKAAGKSAKPDRDFFITPANPKPRAVLGNKTTNAKAFQTPAPLKGPEKQKDSEKPSSNRPTSPRLHRPKIKVHGSTDVRPVVPGDPEEREIEYMPPREVPLEENFDDICPRDRDYSMLEGKNFTRGWWSEFAPKRDVDEPDLSDFEENLKKAEERERKELQVRKPAASKASAGRVGLKAAPSTTKSQSAASALGSKPTKSTAPSFAAPTAAAGARLPPTSSTATKKPMFDRGNPRFVAAKVASKSTIGYSKGRAVSSARRPLSDIHSELKTEPVEKRSTLDALLSLGSLDMNDEDDNLGLGGPNSGLDLLTEDDEDVEVFQLDEVRDL